MQVKVQRQISQTAKITFTWILTTSLIHFVLKWLEEYALWTWGWKDETRDQGGVHYFDIINNNIIIAVPCYKRCKDMEHQEENEAIVEPDEDGGWVDTHHNVDLSGNQMVPGAQESFAEMTLDSDKVLY